MIYYFFNGLLRNNNLGGPNHFFTDIDSFFINSRCFLIEHFPLKNLNAFNEVNDCVPRVSKQILYVLTYEGHKPFETIL